MDLEYKKIKINLAPLLFQKFIHLMILNFSETL